MRGRLRIDGRVFGENPSWLEVPVEYWSKRLPAGSDAPVIPEPILAPGDETPKYGAQSPSRQCLGVEPIPRQKYTSLKNLQDAGKKKQKELLKKN